MKMSISFVCAPKCSQKFLYGMPYTQESGEPGYCSAR